MTPGRAVARLVALVLVYAGLVVWLTWPLAGALATHLPCTEVWVCRFDTIYSAWAASWVSHALATAPFHVGDANIYHPTAHALYYGPAAFGVVPYVFPTFLVTGNAALAINVAFLSCATLTAVALHWVVWRWTGDGVAGFAAAWTLLMNRWFLWGFIPTTPHLVAIQYLPLVVFLAAAPLETWRRAAALLVLVVVQCLTDPLYIAPATLLPLAALALARLLRRTSRPSGWRLAAVVAAVPLCLAPAMIGYVAVRRENPSLAVQTLWKEATKMNVGRADVLDLDRLFWAAQPAEQPGPLSVGVAVLALIAAGALAVTIRRRWGRGAGFGRPWAVAGLWVLVGTLIALPPVAMFTHPTLDGQWVRTPVPLPQAVLAAHTSFYRVLRVPARLGVAGLIGICLLAGLALAELGRTLPALGIRGRPGRAARVLLAVATAVLVYRHPPLEAPALQPQYPLQRLPVADAEMARLLRARDGPVLELPVVSTAAARHPRRPQVLPAVNAAAMYRSTLHWRPLVNGYSSYWPAAFGRRVGPTSALPDRAALTQLVCDTGVRTIVVTLSYYPRERQGAWWRAGRDGTDGLRFVARHAGLLVFEVTIPLPGEPGGPTCPATPS